MNLRGFSRAGRRACQDNLWVSSYQGMENSTEEIILFNDGFPNASCLLQSAKKTAHVWGKRGIEEDNE